MNVMNIDVVRGAYGLFNAMAGQRDLLNELPLSMNYIKFIDNQKRREKMIKKQLLYVLAALVAVEIMVASTCAAFWFGRLSAVLVPMRSQERLMCAAYETNLRTAPTGYVIGHIDEGAYIWYLGLDLPFARVAYYDGDEWLEGTVTATVLEPCIFQK